MKTLPNIEECSTSLRRGFLLYLLLKCGYPTAVAIEHIQTIS